MLTGEIKNKIDKLWQDMFGAGYSIPLNDIMTLTYLIFIKNLDEMELRKENNAELLGFEYKSIFPKDKPFFRWNNFKNLDPSEMLNIMTMENGLFDFIKNLDSYIKDTTDEALKADSAYSKYMRDAVWEVRSPVLLDKLVKGIDSLPTVDDDIKGDLFEYVLSSMNAAGDIGAFRTPRHIINMMVELVKPTIDDKILDPAMGTSGFLIGACQYIQKNYEKELMNPDKLNYFNNEMFNGYDSTSIMVQIGAMNMMMHGVANPQLDQMDSLSTDNNISGEYSLILANPPFAGSLAEEQVNPNLLQVTKTKKTELLFCALFLRMLKIGGRCASIVPDGVLFGSSNAHKSLRKKIVDENRLEAIISMPSGVFKPYAGVSTAIIIFTKTGTGGTDNVWFYDMKSDGYSLDDKRTDLGNQGDIPDIINRFNNLEGELNRARTEQSFMVPKQEIIDNSYDLSINKYKKVEYVAKEYPPSSEILASIKEIERNISIQLEELERLLAEEANSDL